MRFIQYLMEASNIGDAYSEFQRDFKQDVGQDAPSANKILGLLNRRTYKTGQDATQDYITNWFLTKGFLQKKGSMVVPTGKGSELRQSLSNPNRNTSDSALSKASNNGYKALRRYFMDVTDESTRKYLESLDEKTLNAIAKARELEQEDIAILNGIRDKTQNHKERISYITNMYEKNPDRFNRLVELEFLSEKGFVFRKDVWDDFVNTINALDPARIKTLIPSFYQWSTHSSGNVAKNINQILFAVHPSSRNQTEKGRLVWDIIKNLDTDTFNMLKKGKRPQQGELYDESYKLLTTIVPSIINSFPEANSPDDLIKLIDKAFDSRVDFKSLDRSANKTASRRQGVKNTLRQY